MNTRRIRTSEKGGERADNLAYRNGKNIQRECGLWIVGADALFQSLHVTLAARESEKATLMIEQIFQFVIAELFVAQEIRENARIEIARACAHRDAAGGREAHGGIDRYSIAEGAKARSVTEMRKNRTFGKAFAEVMHQRFISRGTRSVEYRSSSAEEAAGVKLPPGLCDERHRREQAKWSADGKIFCAEPMSFRACGMCSGAK